MLSPSFLLKKTDIKTGKQLLFYMTAMIWILSYTLLASNIAIILSEKLSVLFVGIFMGTSSFVCIFTDIPIGYMQKIISARWLLFLSVIGLIFTIGVFLASGSAIYLTFLAVIVYGVSYDLYDITMMSYIFGNAHPESYSQDISQKDVSEALGLMGGLVVTAGFTLVSGIINPLWLILMFFVVTGLFILIFFNKTEYDVEWTELDAKVMADKFTPQELIHGLGDFLVSTKKVALDKIGEAAEALKQKITGGNVIVLKPIRPLQKFEKQGFLDELKKSFQGVGSIFFPPKAPLLWSGFIIGFFSFWDTFVATFQPIFIATKVIQPAGLTPFYGTIIIALFIIPFFLCQVPFAKFADKIGRPLFMYAGLLIAGASIIGFSYSHDVFWTILMGLANSVGYAAAFSAGQGFFAQRFQENYAVLHNTQTMDSNISAGPLEMLLNMGNVIGTLIGGVLITLFDFDITFIVIGGFLLVTFFVSLLGVYWVTRPIVKPAAQPESLPLQEKATISINS